MGLAEAAKACGVSVSTLRRKRTDLEAHGAAQTATGWHIPITALIALGLMERVTPPPAPDTPHDGVTGELEALRAKLAAAEQRAAIAEAVAAERERMIQTQAMALRMLEATKAPAPAVPGAAAPALTEGTATAPPTPDTTKDRPSEPAPLRLWRRLSGARR